ncbi:hypothetical protein [Streptomyces sp. CA-251251]
MTGPRDPDPEGWRRPKHQHLPQHAHRCPHPHQDQHSKEYRP